MVERRVTKGLSRCAPRPLECDYAEGEKDVSRGQGEREASPAALDLVITRARGGCEMVAGNARRSKNRRKN